VFLEATKEFPVAPVLLKRKNKVSGHFLEAQEVSRVGSKGNTTACGLKEALAAASWRL